MIRVIASTVSLQAPIRTGPRTRTAAGKFFFIFDFLFIFNQNSYPFFESRFVEKNQLESAPLASIFIPYFPRILQPLAKSVYFRAGNSAEFPVVGARQNLLVKKHFRLSFNCFRRRGTRGCSSSSPRSDRRRGPPSSSS